MIRTLLRTVGFRPQRLPTAWRGWRRFVRDRKAYRAMCGPDDAPFGPELAVLSEWEEPAGMLGAYFFQDQLVARWIHEARPARHVDVGSRVDGFVGSLSVFREVEVFDIRPQPATVRNVKFHQVDLMRDLGGEWEACTDSLSCLHTIEHFGLGRYGDPLDPQGSIKGLAQLQRMVEPGGVLYLSTPIGPERVEFNAHRVFAVATLVGWFAQGGWEIERFAVITDEGKLRDEVDWQSPEVAHHFGCNLGVGVVAARKTGVAAAGFPERRCLE